jgi:RNA polymerase sigma-70 factor (ECF subfamily)
MSPVDPPNPQPPEQERYESFVRLLVGREARLRAFLRTLLPTWTEVDDVLQETSLVAWRKFAQFEEGTNFLNWLFAIARFEALKHLRKQARSPLVFSDELLELLAAESEADTDQLDAESRALHECLEQLEPAQRELLERAYQTGARFNEVAAQAGRSATGFYKVIQRLRAALLECVQRRLRTEGAA